MKPVLLSVITAIFAATTAVAQSPSPEESAAAWAGISMQNSDSLNDFLWSARPIVVFADSDADPRLEQQIALLKVGADALAERDVVVLIDTSTDAPSALRKELRPRGFMLVLIGKDGGVKLRKPFPWNARELTRVIDKIPMRQREVRERRQP